MEGSTRLVPLAALWHILIDGLNPIWPASHTKLASVSLGDVWPCTALKSSSVVEGDDLIPFHPMDDIQSRGSYHPDPEVEVCRDGRYDGSA